MYNTSNTTAGTDNFEAIAQDAVKTLIAASITLKMMGEKEFSRAIAESASECVERAIALGGV